MDFQEIWERVKDLLAPRLCAVCGNRLDVGEKSVCDCCLKELPYTDYHQKPYDNDLAKLFWKKTNIEKATALFFYYPKAEYAAIIYDLKYHNQPRIGYNLGRFAALRISQQGFFDGMDAIVPVPLSKERVRDRGYNQSEFIAEGLSHVCGLPVWKNVVKRVDFSASQTQVRRNERAENVENAFRLTDALTVAGKHILIVDDIVTTGATICACAKTLESAGNVKISVFSFGFTK